MCVLSYRRTYSPVCCSPSLHPVSIFFHDAAVQSAFQHTEVSWVSFMPPCEPHHSLFLSSLKGGREEKERAYRTHQSFKLLRIVHRLGVRDGGVTRWSAWWTAFISLEQWRWIQVKNWKELTINYLVIIVVSASKDIKGTRKVYNREFWSNLNIF